MPAEAGVLLCNFSAYETVILHEHDDKLTVCARITQIGDSRVIKLYEAPITAPPDDRWFGPTYS